MTESLLFVDRVRKSFRTPGVGRVTALDGVSLSVCSGETIGVVGGNGAGKSTLARVVVGLLSPDAGAVHFEGRDLSQLSRGARRRAQQHIHLVFQNPYASLAPRMRVVDLVAEPLTIHRVGGRVERRRRAMAALSAAQLVPSARYADSFPHQLSGGERQRVALARALVSRPRLVVADEPTQMLDTPTRGELLRLMADLRATHGLTYIYITHDLALAQDFCDRLVVLNRGRVVEQGPTDTVLNRPADPYTATLVGAANRLHLTRAPGQDPAGGSGGW